MNLKQTALIAVTVAIAMFLAGCATVSKPTIVKQQGLEQVSPSVQQSAQDTKSGLKRKVAIARFSNETNYGQSIFIKDNPEKVGKQALDMLSTKLAATGKFILLERSDLALLNNELNIGSLDPISNMADYLIIGSVVEFGRKDEGEVGVFGRTKKQTAHAKVMIRLVDVRNGIIIYSEEGSGEASSEVGTVLGVGSQAGYDSSLNDKALDAAITKLSSNVIENLLQKPWTSFVLAIVGNGDVIIAGGKSQNMKTGDKFSVVCEGERVINPQTNMFITLPGKKVAEIEITALMGVSEMDETSLCRVLSGSLNEFQGSLHTLRVVEQEMRQ